MKRLIALAAALFGMAQLPLLAPAQPAAAPGKDVARLIAELQSKEPAAALRAVKALAELGPRAEPAVPELLQLLKTGDEHLRLNAVLTLGRVGKPAVAAIVKALRTRDDDERYYLFWALGRIGPEALPALGAAHAALANSSSSQVRCKAVYALGGMAGESRQALGLVVQALRDADPDVRQTAADVLARLGPLAVPPLTPSARAPAVETRLLALAVLARIGPEVDGVLPVLRDRLCQDPDARVRAFVADRLVDFGPVSLPLLARALKHSNPQVRRLAIEALERLGLAAAPVVIEALESLDPHVRQKAVQYLGHWRVADRFVVLALGDALGDPNDGVRVSAASALAELGEEARPARWPLSRALLDRNLAVRKKAYAILVGWGEDVRGQLLPYLKQTEGKARFFAACVLLGEGLEIMQSASVLREAFSESDFDLRHQSAYVLALAGREARLTAPVLIEGMKSADDEVRERSATALARLARQVSEAVPVLTAALKDPAPAVRQQAMFALQALPPDPERMLPVLAELLQETDVSVRLAAVQVLPRFGADAGPHLLLAGRDADPTVRRQTVQSLFVFKLPAERQAAGPVLEQALADAEPGVRQTAVNVLAHFGADSVPRLAEVMLQDRDPGVRWTAASALGKLGPQAAPAVAALAQAAAGDANATVRKYAVFALAQMKPQDGIEPLAKLLSCPQPDVRLAALAGLKQHAAAAQAAVPAIIELVQQAGGNLRLAAIQTLGHIGPDARAALPVLQEAGNDPDAAVRESAEQAIRRIQGD